MLLDHGSFVCLHQSQVWTGELSQNQLCHTVLHDAMPCTHPMEVTSSQLPLSPTCEGYITTVPSPSNGGYVTPLLLSPTGYESFIIIRLSPSNGVYIITITTMKVISPILHYHHYYHSPILWSLLHTITTVPIFWRYIITITSFILYSNHIHLKGSNNKHYRYVSVHKYTHSHTLALPHHH